MKAPAFLRFTLAWAAVGLLPPRAAVAQEPPLPPAPVREIGGVRYHEIDFYRLSAFTYRLVDASTGATTAEIAAAQREDRIPAGVRRYDGKPVALTGFMLPLKLDQGLATSFILMRDITTCCFGNTPRINEFVVVTMPGRGVRAVQDVPVTLLGTFRIVERLEEGYQAPIFEMTGERLLD